MNKYYVSCGTVKTVLTAVNEKEAAIEVAVKHFDEESELDHYVKVSERGFCVHNEDEMFDLNDILSSAGFEFEEDDEQLYE